MDREREKELYEQYEDICNQHKYCADCYLRTGSDGKALNHCDCLYFYNRGMKEFAEKLKEKIKRLQDAELSGQDMCPSKEDVGGCPYMNSDIGCQYCAREVALKDIDELLKEVGCFDE